MSIADILFTSVPVVGKPDLVFGDEGGSAIAPPAQYDDSQLHGDLLFQRPPVTGRPQLVFGDTGEAGEVALPDPVDLSAAGELAGLRGHITLAVQSVVQSAGRLTGLRGHVLVQSIARITSTASLSGVGGYIAASYDINVERVTVAGAQSHWQAAAPSAAAVQARYQPARQINAARGIRYQESSSLQRPTAAHWQSTKRLRLTTATRYQESQRLQSGAKAGWQEAMERRVKVDAKFQEALHLALPAVRSRWQEAFRNRFAAADTHWQEAARVLSSVSESEGAAVALQYSVRPKYQEAWMPRPGRSVIHPVVVPPNPCYLPAPNLLFDAGWSADGNLVFICERHSNAGPGASVVVAIKRTYVTINSITLRRVEGDVAIPTYAFAMSLDVDSWTWSWSATVPMDALALVRPGSSGEPVEVEALVNGVAYRLCAESVASQRQFGQARIAVKGRGKAALLDAPYAPTRNFGNTAPRTAQQLMTDVLTVNGVGIGWAVDWGLTDWLVPGNVWTHQGAYISAILAIASAVGGYVQPHATQQTLRILPRYPVAPWNWAAITPDFELPASVVAVEGIEWTRKADYNRVFVSGTKGGVLGQVTRAGTAGDSVAPMVTDPLITHANAARQRGLSVLADTGSQARVNLTLPVLAETGLITPGQMVRYVDGSDSRLGLVRSTALSWSYPKLRQTLAVETHA